MKRFFHIALALVVLCGCSKGYDYSGPTEDLDGRDGANAPGNPYSAIVTVKQGADSKVFFQLDENTRLIPQNYTHPYKGMERVICELTETTSGCFIEWMDFLEKGAATLASAVNTDGPAADLATLSDGVDVLGDWMTTVEDGFLTLHYSTWWGDGLVRHSLSVLTGANPENPYELWLLHSRAGDAALEEGDALIYFDINSLPSTEGEYVTLTLKWLNGEGHISSRDFRFRTRTE